MQDIKQQEEINNRIQELHNWYIENQIILHPERDEVFKNKLLSFLQSEISLALEQEKEMVLAMVLKEIEEFREKCSGFNHAIQALDILKEKLQAKQ